MARFDLPIAHIDQVAESLNIEVRWIKDNWLKRETTGDVVGPAPCFRDGNAIFFNLKELDEWTRRRALGSDYTDTEEGGPSD